MKAVGHVEIDKYLETCGLGQFMLNDRDRLLWNLDVLVDLSIITTKPYEGLSGFRGNNQRRRYGKLTVDVSNQSRYSGSEKKLCARQGQRKSFKLNWSNFLQTIHCDGAKK